MSMTGCFAPILLISLPLIGVGWRDSILVLICGGAGR
jgi:hypothetical protein